MRIEEIEKIRDLEFERLKKEYVFAGNEDGDLEILGRKFIFMGSDYFMADFFILLQRMVGEGAGGILYNAGYKIGEKYATIQKFSGSLEETIGKFFGFLKFCGYSELKFMDENRIGAIASPTAIAFRKKYVGKKDMTCYYLAGLLAGFLSKVMGKKVEVKEVKCIAMGNKFCEFVLE